MTTARGSGAEVGEVRGAGPFLDPQVVEADRHRRAARVLVLDGDRLLVERVCVASDPAQGSWWELPGGGLEPGESSAEAARRELAEETGYLDVEVGPVIATRRVRYRSSVVAEQHETFHAGRLNSDRRIATTLDIGERTGLLETAWVGLDQLADGRRTEPVELVALARQLRDGVRVPWRLADADDLGWSDQRPQPGSLPDGARPHPSSDRVVRDAAPWTPAGHAWLAHCEAVGVRGVPAPLGIDGHGREAVTFVPGEVAGEGGRGLLPEALRTTEGIAAVGALLAALRSAADTFRPPPDAVWRDGPTALVAGQVLCHGDVGPANLVWRPDGSPALIDWEFAHPGPPLRDLAAAACMLVPLAEFDHERRGYEREPDRRARLHALATAGGTDVDTLLGAVTDHLDTESARVTGWGSLGIPPWSTFLTDGQPAWFERMRRYLGDHDLR